MTTTPKDAPQDALLRERRDFLGDAHHPLFRCRYVDKALYARLPVELARIESARLYRSDRGPVLDVAVKYGAAVQSFVFGPSSGSDQPGASVGNPGTMEFILAMLRLFGVDSLDEMKGRYVYTIKDRVGHGGYVVGFAQVEPEGSAFLLVEDWRRWADHFPVTRLPVLDTDLPT